MRDQLVCFYICMYTKSRVSFFALHTLASFMDDVHSLLYSDSEYRHRMDTFNEVMNTMMTYSLYVRMYAYIYIYRKRDMVLEAFELCHQ